LIVDDDFITVFSIPASHQTSIGSQGHRTPPRLVKASAAHAPTGAVILTAGFLVESRLLTPGQVSDKQETRSSFLPGNSSGGVDIRDSRRYLFVMIQR
jgi:hypothetical protein